MKATYVFVQSGVLLGDRLKPYDLTSRETHDEIYMGVALGDLVDIVTEAMAFGK